MGNGGAFPGKALEELTASELAEGAARLGPSYAAALRSISMYVVVCALRSLPSVTPCTRFLASLMRPSRRANRTGEEERTKTRAPCCAPDPCLRPRLFAPSVVPLCFALALAHAFLALASHRFSPLRTAFSLTLILSPPVLLASPTTLASRSPKVLRSGRRGLHGSTKGGWTRRVHTWIVRANHATCRRIHSRNNITRGEGRGGGGRGRLAPSLGRVV